MPRGRLNMASSMPRGRLNMASSMPRGRLNMASSMPRGRLNMARHSAEDGGSCHLGDAAMLSIHPSPHLAMPRFAASAAKCVHLGLLGRVAQVRLGLVRIRLDPPWQNGASPPWVSRCARARPRRSGD